MFIYEPYSTNKKKLFYNLRFRDEAINTSFDITKPIAQTWCLSFLSTPNKLPVYPPYSTVINKFFTI